jgi:sulfur-carrier protein adenylyltransferase/sulfurtransferase
MSLSPAELARYNRHLLLPEIGIPGQEKLKAARVLVVGAGGLGSPAALYLAAAGVGTVGIADGDQVDASNLHRQILFDAADVGQPKTEAAARRLRALNPEIQVEPHACRMEAGNVLQTARRYDVVVDGSDRLATRYLLNDACVILRIPLVSAAIHRFEGQAMTYVPDAGPCYRCLFAQASDDVVPNCAQAGVLGVLPGVLGSIQATEAIKIIVGIGASLTGRLLTYDALAMQFNEYSFRRREDCAVCGKSPTIFAPVDSAQDTAALEGLRRFSARELAGALARVRLIDVREPPEFQAGHLNGSINIPLGLLDSRFPGLQPDMMAVFVCRSGARSLRACAIAARHGAAEFGHLDGGLLAWAADIDSSLTV